MQREMKAIKAVVTENDKIQQECGQSKQESARLMDVWQSKLIIFR